MSDLSPECAPKRTSADHSELWVHALVIEFWRLSIFTATSGIAQECAHRPSTAGSPPWRLKIDMWAFAQDIIWKTDFTSCL
jgi:hypothetical protein